MVSRLVRGWTVGNNGGEGGFEFKTRRGVPPFVSSERIERSGEKGKKTKEAEMLHGTEGGKETKGAASLGAFQGNPRRDARVGRRRKKDVGESGSNRKDV